MSESETNNRNVENSSGVYDFGYAKLKSLENKDSSLAKSMFQNAKPSTSKSVKINAQNLDSLYAKV